MWERVHPRGGERECVRECVRECAPEGGEESVSVREFVCVFVFVCDKFVLVWPLLLSSSV